MSKSGQIVEFSLSVNDLLSQYIEIHDDIFKTSIRRIIPIPGIFKAIDFEGHLTKSEHIGLVLANRQAEILSLIIRSEGLEREYLDLLNTYVEKLIETVGHLKVVLRALYAKSRSFKDSNYDWSNYKEDLARYEQSVDDYLAIGGILNDSFQRLNR